METDKNCKYLGFMEQNEAIKDTIQPDIGAGKEVILLIYGLNVSNSSWLNFRKHWATRSSEGEAQKVRRKIALKSRFLGFLLNDTVLRQW